MSSFFICFLFFIVLPKISCICPFNGIPGVNGESKCYYLFSNPQNFIDALQTCEDLGGHLVSICNAFENSYLLDKASSRFRDAVWIGYNDLTTKGTWTWADSNNECSSNYTNWNKGQPVTGDCASLSLSNGMWQSVDCNSLKIPLICETTNVIQPTSSPAKPTCGDNYTWFSQTNFCYKVYRIPNNGFMDAESKCVSEGGHLASIHGAQEKEFIDSLAIDVESTCYWIGLYNYFTDFVTWEWTDGSEFQYASWAAGQPDKGTGHFCTLTLGGSYPNQNGTITWYNAFNCSTWYNFVCKRGLKCA